MTNKKLSSIEWFVKITSKYDKHFAEFYKSEIEQAKELHKHEIMDAVNFGDERGKITRYLTKEQYYQETFKQEEK